jgi:hypothetical protein
VLVSDKPKYNYGFYFSITMDEYMLSPRIYTNTAIHFKSGAHKVQAIQNEMNNIFGLLGQLKF